MHPRSEVTSSADLAGEAGGLLVGLGVVTTALFPFAVPLLILTFGPLLPLAVLGLVLVLPILLPYWLGRLLLRALRRHPKGPAVAHRPRGQLAQ
jgi:hypothetical protein